MSSLLCARLYEILTYDSALLHCAINYCALNLSLIALAESARCTTTPSRRRAWPLMLAALFAFQVRQTAQAPGEKAKKKGRQKNEKERDTHTHTQKKSAADAFAPQLTLCFTHCAPHTSAQIALCLLTGHNGISVVWNALLGWFWARRARLGLRLPSFSGSQSAAAAKRPRSNAGGGRGSEIEPVEVQVDDAGSALLLASCFALVANLFYLFTEENITTVAHLASWPLGLAIDVADARLFAGKRQHEKRA